MSGRDGKADGAETKSIETKSIEDMTIDAMVRHYGISPEQARQSLAVVNAGHRNKDIFTDIYLGGKWGKGRNSSRQFYSGAGSHHRQLVGGYVAAVTQFLKSLGQPPRIVDLGCGDFNVGAQLLPHCASYLACDIVAPVIAENRALFNDERLEFRVLDIVEEDIPGGDVIILRQVLQHLCNDDVAKVLAKMPAAGRYLIVTEHLPSKPDFIANLDKPRGPGTRLFIDSGVVLSRPPFNLAARQERLLTRHEGPNDGGIIETMLYEFA